MSSLDSIKQHLTKATYSAIATEDDDKRYLDGDVTLSLGWLFNPKLRNEVNTFPLYSVVVGSVQIRCNRNST